MMWIIYAVGVVDSVRGAGWLSFGAGLIAGVVALMILSFAKDESGDERKQTLAIGQRFLKIGAAIAVLGFGVTTFVPKSTTLAAMFVIPAVAENEQIQQITGNALSALEGLTREWAEDLAPADDERPDEQKR